MKIKLFHNVSILQCCRCSYSSARSSYLCEVPLLGLLISYVHGLELEDGSDIDFGHPLPLALPLPVIVELEISGCGEECGVDIVYHIGNKCNLCHCLLSENSHFQRFLHI